MKTQSKSGTLEKIISSVKETAKNAGKSAIQFCKDNARYAIMLGASLGAGYAMSGEKAEGGYGYGYIEIRNRGPPDITAGSVYIKKMLGATESFDLGKDISYLGGPSPILQVYSVNNNCDPNKLSTEAKDINSTTPDNLELVNNGFTGSRTNILTTIIKDPNNLEWKNIFLGDANNSENPVADIKHLVYTSGKFINDYPSGEFVLGTLQGTTTGVYDWRKIMYFNHADLNRDKKVNFKDYAIYAWNFGKDNISDPNRFGSYVGKDVNDLGAYADIDRSGSVDVNDLDKFSQEWLWDANDSSTW